MNNCIVKQTAFLLILFIVYQTPTHAQSLVWHNVDTSFGKLPASLHVFHSTTPIEGKPSNAYYAIVDLHDKGLDITAQTGHDKRFTPSQYFEQEGHPLLVVNCTFFSFETNQNLNLVMRRGSMQAFNVNAVKPKGDSMYHYVTRSAIGIDRKRKPDVAWCFTDSSMRYPFAMTNGPSEATGSVPSPTWPMVKQQLKGGGRKKVKWKMETAVGGGPVLLQMGRIGITNKEERMFVNGLHDRHPRTAMGYTNDGKLIILVVEGRNPGIAEGASLQHLAVIMRSLGCHEALNLDGGGSSCMLINGRQTITPSDKEGQRPVPAVFLINAYQ